MKIILKDHLQPVVPEIGSYHIKTVFLNTLEKLPVGFWVEENIEECLLTLLTELRGSLVSRKCWHHWFSSVNLFHIDGKKLQILARKIDRIIKDPAPFIFDDGCCCLSPCYLRVPQYNFTRRSSQQFFANYEEVTISVDGDVIPLVQDPVTQRFLEPATRGARSDSSSHPRDEESLQTTATPELLVVCLPPTCNIEREYRHRQAEQFQPDPCGARSDSSSHPRNEESLQTTATPQQLVVCLPPICNTERECRHRQAEPFHEEIPLSVYLPPIYSTQLS